MKTKCIFKILLLLILPGALAENALAQDCSVNAGGNAIVCGASATLTGAASGNNAGNSVWTFVSGPVTPAIVSPNALTTDVTGMTADGDYIFQLSQPCGTGTAQSTVTITAHSAPPDFAGPDITNVCATTGTTTLQGVIPPGFTGTWRAVNIFNLGRFGTTVSTNAQFSDNMIATPVFSLINKSNHTIDPAYYVILKITSLDGVCSYEDTAIVRFIPNPQINPNLNSNQCLDPESTTHFINLSSPPYFATDITGSAGTVANGTTVTMNVISQPAGGAVSLNRISDNNYVFLDGINVEGTYTFTLTVTNSCGTYTTPDISYTYLGTRPHSLNFQPAGHDYPEQLQIYSSVGTGGEVHCGIAGTATPETFYFSIDPDDAPTVLTTVSADGIIPGGVAPTITTTGDGTYNRSVTVTPPAGGWQIGTYRFDIELSNGDGSCAFSDHYYIHISDESRPELSVPDISVCYPGTGAIAAAIPLPAVYKGAVNASYFQDFNGWYNIAVVSKPAGAANPVFETSNLRTLTDTSTVISNLNMPGDYVFRLTPFNGNGADSFIQQEYACSGFASPLSALFTVHVENLINPNAGSDQELDCISTADLIGNDPGVGAGIWTVASAPVGATPVFADDNATQTNVTGLERSGIYQFGWTITTPLGGCVNTDTVQVEIANCLPVAIDDYYTVPPDTTLNATVAANDTCGNVTCTYTLDPDRTTHNGTVNVNPDGTFTYIPDAGFTGNDTFYYSICDVDDDCDTAMGIIMIDNALPIELIGFTGKDDGYCNANLQWQTATENNFEHFELERSSDTRSYNLIASLAAKGNNSQYNYTDNDVPAGDIYYRLKIVDANKDYSYSKVIKVSNDCIRKTISFYPNPVKENVTITGLKGSNTIYLSNSLGQVLIRETSAKDIKNLSTARLAPGIYMITVQDENNNKYNFKMVKQ